MSGLAPCCSGRLAALRTRHAEIESHATSFMARSQIVSTSVRMRGSYPCFWLFFPGGCQPLAG